MADLANSKVFVVEDDVFISKAYNAKFAHENVPADFAADGIEALEKLRTMKELPRVILLDLMLPKKSGFEVLEEIKKDAKLKDVPILILTNLGQDQDAKRGMELGAAEYLVKANMKIEDIVAKVKQYL